MASLLKDLRHYLSPGVSGDTHQARLVSYYADQAEIYDESRKRLLFGREEAFAVVSPPPGGVWIDFGGGTGSNAALLRDELDKLAAFYIVDLCDPLLEVARRRFPAATSPTVKPVLADATTFTPDEGAADVVSFSYSLSMIPEWYKAIDNAHRLLRPGGAIIAVDFYVSERYPPQGRTRHGGFTRGFWRWWFERSNVHLAPDRLNYLAYRFESERLDERVAVMPYTMGLKAPYYIFVGRKRAEATVPGPDH